MTANSLHPFEPTRERPWDRAAAAHLLRRAGFVPSPAEIQRATDDGLDATVTRLIEGEAESAHYAELDRLGAALSRRNDIERLRGWWLLRMRHTTRPLHARMALFWHDHFATSNAKVRDAGMMYRQLRSFEKHAFGPFDRLLLAVSRDPAMILWLDGDLNVKGRPNENYAREVFELFSLGVGNYTERDIKEAARAFTGWHQRRGAFRFVASSHDDGVKEIFGERGRFGGEDVIRLALARPAAASYLATKLLHEFVSPHPPASLVSALATRLAESRFAIGTALRTLLASEAMFAPEHRGVRIKSPVEYVVGLARSLDARASGPELSRAAGQMGQRLFEPPSVKGWDGHRKWIGAATMLIRMNTASRMARSGADDDGGFDAGRTCSRYGVRSASEARRLAARIAFGGAAPSVVRTRLERIEGAPPVVLVQCLRVLFACPEYQMA